jgi:hypothetical protein
VAVLLSVASSLLVGGMLVVAPWTALWDGNYLLQPHPVVRAIVLSAFTRGAITGLGLVNILLAVDEVRSHLQRPRHEA